MRAGSTLHLDEALRLARTGDLWLFRGRKPADRAIQLATNAPVNHVGMTLLIDDLPPMMWHAELGRSLPDRWTGGRHRGAQLHDLGDAVRVWAERYGQRAWLRQLDPPVGRAAEDAALRLVARLDGMPFPSLTMLSSRWLRGRLPRVPQWPRPALRAGASDSVAAAGEPVAGPPSGLVDEPAAELEAAYCAEVVALTYQAMGLLPADRRPSWYDPGRFWSGDGLQLTNGHGLGGELAVSVPGAERAGRRRSTGPRGGVSRPAGRLQARRRRSA